VPGYEILGVLGRGGMGVVYKARHSALHRLVALKMILNSDHADPLELARFRAEADALAQLQHPNIIQIFEVGECAGRPFLALEYLEGGSLAAKLAESPLPPPEAARLVETLAHAIHAAHLRHIIHRDLKPANVLLTADGAPKITDFGLAKRLDAGPGLTRTNAVMGTPSYMAPEQASGKTAEIGPAADVYALGALLYEALTGRPPFHGPTSLDTLHQVLVSDPVAPRRLQPRTPRDLETVCLKCLEKQPGRRYASASDLAEDLRRFQAGEPVRARPIYRLRRVWRRVRWPAFTALVILAVAGLLLWGLRRGDPRPSDEPQSLAISRACQPVPWVPAPVEEVAGKPPARDLSGFEVLEISRFWDFSRWRPVAPEDVHGGRYEPAFCTTVLRLRKRPGRTNNDTLIWHFRTSGYAVDPRCSDRPCRVRKYSYLDEMPRDPQGRTRRTMTVWEAEIDLSEAGNNGAPFDLAIYSIWWNAYQDQARGEPSDWLADRLDFPVGAVNEAILLPPGKRLKSWGFSAFPKDTNQPFPSEESPGTYVDPTRGKLFWQIPDPQQDWVYRIDWRWQDR